MDQRAFASQQVGASVSARAKSIADLDDLVQALRSGLPREKPWQRQLHAHLIEVDRQIQVLRLTISLVKSAVELSSAVNDVQRTIRDANGYVSAGRADMGTKLAMRLCLDLRKGLGS